MNSPLYSAAASCFVVLLAISVGYLLSKYTVLFALGGGRFAVGRDERAYASGVGVLLGSLAVFVVIIATARTPLLRPTVVVMGLGLIIGALWWYPRYRRRLRRLLFTPGEHQGLDAIETHLRVKAKSTTDCAWKFFFASYFLISFCHFVGEEGLSFPSLSRPLPAFWLLGAVAYGVTLYCLIRRLLALQIFPRGNPKEWERELYR